MKSVPRILPLVGVAIGGVLAINAIGGARDLPNLVSGAKAWAEEAAKPAKSKKGKDDAKAGEAAATGDAADTAAAGLPPPSIKPAPVCAPTAAELAKEAGLSPAELQVLQNLGARRDQLDQQQTDLNTQLAVLAAAEAKLDAKAKALEGLKGDIQKLLDDANGREDAEIDRLVQVFQAMKPKDAAPRMVALDDAVRLPIAAKLKPRALSAILAQMPPADAKKLTEALARRFSAAQTLAQSGVAQANPATPAPAAAGAQPNAQASAAAPSEAKPAAKPVKQARRKPRPRKRAPASAQASAKPAAPKDAGAAPAEAAAPPAPKAG